MIGLPRLGARVQVWPAPGRKVQHGERTLDSGGRWMRAHGETVVWSEFHLEQLRAGDILLHPPPCKEHDFGSQGKDGKLEHEHCRRCGRDMKAAQEYDVHHAAARKAAQARAEAAKRAKAAAAEVAEIAPLPAAIVDDGAGAVHDVFIEHHPQKDKE